MLRHLLWLIIKAQVMAIYQRIAYFEKRKPNDGKNNRYRKKEPRGAC
jgi:hypothetical protein